MLAAALAIGMLAAVNPAPAEAATVDTNAWYVLVNRNSGKALDVSGTSAADGAQVSQWTRHDVGGGGARWAAFDGGHAPGPVDGSTGDNGATTWTKAEIWRFFAQFQ
ncbi:RICIN domain-containing protein [Streptomyces sp. NPDC050121]|uniref:RICIN domain-containing protein n=1 Tax=Streptomyces sp. NPDC050121 TaxID=3365601 RepID=UPI0037A0E8B8